MTYPFTCRSLIESYQNNERQVLIKLPNLTFISIKKCDLSYDKFEIFIKKISIQLQVFHINTSTTVIYLDADRWERLILKHMSYLHKFHFIYHESTLPNFHLSSYHAQTHYITIYIL